MIWTSPSAARRAGAIAFAWIAITRIAWTVAETISRRGAWLDRHLDEVATLLDLARRASRGEWSGRDFEAAHGPVMQLVAWAGSGFGAWGPVGASVGIEVLVAVVSMACAVALATSAAETPGRRVVLWLLAVVGTTWLGTSALPVILSLFAGSLVASGSPRRVAAAAVLAFTTHLVSGPAGVLCLAGCAFGLAARRSSGSPRLFAATTLGLHAGLALAVAPALGSSWTRLVPGAVVAVAAQGAGAWDARESGGEAVLVLFAIAVVALAWGGRRRDLPASTLAFLAASLPLGLAARGPDATAVFSGAFPIAFALAAAALSDEAPRLRPRSRALALAAGLFVVAWLAGHPGPLRPLSPASVPAAWNAIRGRGSRPESETVRALRHARSRIDRSDCLSAAPHARIASWLSGVPDRIDTPDPLRRADCPIHLHHLPARAAPGNGPLLADDVPPIAERYEAVESLGPDFLVMRRRAEDAAAQTRRIDSRRLGRTLAPSGGTMLVPFGAPVESDHLVFVDFSLRPGAWGSILGAPRVGVAFHGPTGLGPVLGVDTRPGRNALVLAVSGSAAQTRWLRGRAPSAREHVDGLSFVFAGSPLVVGSVRIVVHALRELRVGGLSVPPDAGGCGERVALARELAASRVWRRGTPARAADDDVVLESRRDGAPASELFFPIVPCPNRCLSGSIRPRGPRAGSGARVELDVLDGDRTTRLASLAVASKAPFALPLRRWSGREVQLRVALRDPAPGGRRGVVLRDLRVGDCACGPADLVAAVARGEARVRGVEVRERSLYVHPARPGAPPTEALVTVSPCADACLTTSLSLGAPAGGGDGVDFEIDVVNEGSARRIALEHVAPGEAARPFVYPLAEWAGREVQLRLATHPGGSIDFDWASFAAPAVGPCAP